MEPFLNKRTKDLPASLPAASSCISGRWRALALAGETAGLADKVAGIKLGERVRVLGKKESKSARAQKNSL